MINATQDLPPRFKLLRPLLASLLLWCACDTAHAADANRQYHVRAIDKVASCNALNRAVASAKQHDDWAALYGFSLYTMGYLTGINRLAADTYDIGGNKNTKTVMVWLEQYCREHPEDNFDNALLHLTNELFPMRSTRTSH